MMNGKSLSLFILLGFCAGLTFAQTITGKVTGEDEIEGRENAIVTILSDGEPVQQILTDQSGRYSLKIPSAKTRGADDLMLVVSFIGFTNDSIAIARGKGSETIKHDVELERKILTTLSERPFELIAFQPEIIRRPITGWPREPIRILPIAPPIQRLQPVDRSQNLAGEREYDEW